MSRNSHILLEAIRAGAPETVRQILDQEPGLVHLADENGQTPLHLAAQWNDVEVGRLLIEKGAQTDVYMGASSHTPLSWAITIGSLDFANELVRLGVRPDLFSAAGLGHLEIVKRFWQGGKLQANASTTGSSRFARDGSRLPRPPETNQDVISDAFVFACRNGCEDVALFLLDRGADLGFGGYLNGTGLHWSEYSGNQSLCRALRDRGASDDLLDAEFLSVPHAFGLVVTAAWGISQRLGKLLDLYPDRVNIRCGYGTPLNAAAWNGQLETCKLLLSRGADYTDKNKAGLTPLEVARYKQYPELVELFESLPII